MQWKMAGKSESTSSRPNVGDSFWGTASKLYLLACVKA